MAYGQKIKIGAAKTKMVWTLGAASRSVVMIEKLLEAGMNIARFDFSEGSHAHHQETIINLRTAIRNTGILCAVMLDTKVHTFVSLSLSLFCVFIKNIHFGIIIYMFYRVLRYEVEKERLLISPRLHGKIKLILFNGGFRIGSTSLFCPLFTKGLI